MRFVRIVWRGFAAIALVPPRSMGIKRPKSMALTDAEAIASDWKKVVKWR